MRKCAIHEISRPACGCGAVTQLKRVERHPVYGTGFEIRVFECPGCRRETTTETSPETILLSPVKGAPERRSVWAMLFLAGRGLLPPYGHVSASAPQIESARGHSFK